MIVDESKPKDLLRPEVSEAMEKASAQLCALKIRLDRYARQWIGQPFLDDWMDTANGNSCAYFPHSFLWLILPFMEWETSEPKRYRAYVNPWYVLGASILGLPEVIRENEVEKRIAHYAGHFGTSNDVCYIRYPALGLYYAHEGKHRVAFMCAHEQPAIAAWVEDASYPQPERIVVIAPTDKRDEWLALLDERYLQVLRRPRVTLQLLRAYGVKEVEWRDVRSLPDEQRVRAAIYVRKLHRASNSTVEQDRTVDLEEVRKQQREETASVQHAAKTPRRWSFFDSFTSLLPSVAIGVMAGILHRILKERKA